RPGADDGDLAGVNVILDADANGSGEIGHARIDENLAVATNQYWETRSFEPCLLDQLPSGVAFERIEPERQAEPRHHVAQLRHSAVTLRGNEPKQLKARLLLPRPRREVLAHRAVHHLVVRPRAHDVIVSP